jgi:hypothetical protein
VHGVTIRNYNDTVFNAQDEKVRLNITGKNFGLQRFSHSLYVELSPRSNDTTLRPMPCSSFVSYGDANLLCEFSSSQRVETRVVVVSMLGRFTSDVNSTVAVVESRCFPGFFGRAGEICMPCPLGADCPGGDNPLSKPGFWRQSRTKFLQ